jgi:uncharacterized membrane protein YcaP (DUF421 family)
METFYALIGPENGDAAWWQLSLRAALLLLVGIALVRIAGRRTFSQATTLDIVVALIVGANLSRAMTGKAPFLGAIAATFVLVVLHRLLAMATIRGGPLAGFVKGKPVVLVRDGVVDERGLRRAGLSRDDLLEGLRLEQVERPEDARLAVQENGGRISVLPKQQP